MNTKFLSNRTNGKKIIFNKYKNVVPELIPIHAKEPIKNSFAKKNPKPIEEIPEIIWSYIPKPSNICQNDNCQILNINNDDIGRGYCSTKCVVEHSKTLLNYFLEHRKLPNQNCNRDLSFQHKNEPSVNYKNYPAIKTDSFQTRMDLSNNSPTTSFDLPNNFRVNDREPFPLQSPIKSVETIASKQNVNLSDDELEIVEPRESFFNIARKVIFCQEKTQHFENTNVIENISSPKKNSIKKPVKHSSPDVIFLSLNKKPRRIIQQSDNFETIVID